MYLPKVALGLFVVFIIAHHLFQESFTGCNDISMRYDRKSNPDVLGTAFFPLWIRNLLAVHLVQMYWLFLLYFTYKLNKMTFVSLLVYFALWYPGYIIVETAKSYFDPSCHVKGNGISGHFFYFAWALSTVFNFRNILPTSFLPTFLVMGCLMFIQGFMTIHYGYHSYRQCFLGAMVGLLFSWVCERLVILIEKNLSNNNRLLS